MTTLEKNFCRHIQQVYAEISALGLSAKLSRLSTLGKFQHSVNFQEALLSLDLLFRLCDQFRCMDIPELFKLFFIYEYWNRRERTIFATPSITPNFQINENTVTCARADIPNKGCLACSHFDACQFPRVITPDDLSEANWRCMVCGNPLEFPTVLYQKWLSHSHNVKTHFLCCLCFMEYSLTEEGQGNLLGSDLPVLPPEITPLATDFNISLLGFGPGNLGLKDLLAIILGFLSILSFQFEDPRFALYHKIPHPAPQDEIAWETMQIALSQISRSAFDYLASVLPQALASPRLDSLFEYCFGILEPQDLISCEDNKDIVFNFSYKLRDFVYAIVKSPHISRIISTLKENPKTWDKLNAWVATQFT